MSSLSVAWEDNFIIIHLNVGKPFVQQQTDNCFSNNHNAVVTLATARITPLSLFCCQLCPFSCQLSFQLSFGDVTSSSVTAKPFRV